MSPVFPLPTATSFASKRAVPGLTLSTSSSLESVLHHFNSVTFITTDARSTTTVQETQFQVWEMNTGVRTYSLGIERIPDEIAQIMLLTATYYTHAISTLTRFSNMLSPEQLSSTYHLILAVPLSRWQEIPGIFLCERFPPPLLYNPYHVFKPILKT